VVRDISERKRAEEEIRAYNLRLEAANKELEAANERLEALSRVKDEFVSNVSHELRTPITNLKLYLSLLLSTPEKSAAFIATLERETDRLKNMIEGLLTLSRLDQDRVAIKFVALDINELVEEYVGDRTALVESKGLEVTLEMEPELPTLRADASLLGEVLGILLTNAINYTPAGGRVVVRTQERHFQGRWWAGFSVSDSGPGIAQKEQAQLFTRFFRGEVGRSSEVPGTGLGLAIAKEIVERHHGKIEVESEGTPGEGARFGVWLMAEG
jgi:signal transduction histidine kinase